MCMDVCNNVVVELLTQVESSRVSFHSILLIIIIIVAVVGE
jgi:hypothetical protein